MSSSKADECKLGPDDDEKQEVEDLNRVVYSRGFQLKGIVANTLQGAVWEASKTDGDRSRVVVKVTNRSLHRRGIATALHQSLAVQENIVLEASILKYLSNFQDFPKSIVKFCDFFESRRNFYLVEQHGGTPLFDFVGKCHQLIASGRIQLHDWKRAALVIFKQMLQCVEFLHSKRVAHFDLSLENFLINDVAVDFIKGKDNSAERVQFVLDAIQIKLCDFGLAEVFASNPCLSSKHCGKRSYKSPELTHAKPVFDAKKNDIWCLGVSLFMLCFGCGPFRVAHESDALYCLTVIHGKLADVLRAWNKLDFSDKELLELFALIFRPEANRISLTEITEHKWVNN